MDEQLIGKSIYHPGGPLTDQNQLLGRTSLYKEDGTPLNLLTAEDAANQLLSPNRKVVFGGTPDDTAEIQTKATAAAGGELAFLSGVTYIINMATPILIPNNTIVTIPLGCTIKAKNNVATTNQIWRMFGFASSTPSEIHFRGEGLIDGNRRGGNHGAAENVAGIFGSDIDGFSCVGVKFYNFRSEAIYLGHTDGGSLPQRVFLDRLHIKDCGYSESGDASTATRMGVAITAGKDLRVTNSYFETVKGYAIDFEGNRAGDTFDNVHTSGNLFRGCEQGFVNVTSPDSGITNIDIQDRIGNGLYGTVNTIVVPNGIKRNQMIRRTAADLTLTPGNTTWNDLGTISDFVLSGVRVGDLVEVSLSSTWDAAGTFRNIDVASMVSGSAVNYWGTGDNTPLNGVAAWRGNSGTAHPFGGSVAKTIVAGDLNGSTLTLRFRYKFNTATTSVLGASAPALIALAKNLGQC